MKPIRQVVSTLLSEKITAKLRTVLSDLPANLTDRDLEKHSKQLDGVIEEILPCSPNDNTSYLLIKRLPLLYFESRLDLRATRLLLFALGRRLGTPYVTKHHRDETLIFDIKPQKNDVGKQLATGTELGWHTDDAHDSEPCKYIALLCLQGSNACTLISSCKPNLLDEKTRLMLSQPTFEISSDDSYSVKTTLRTSVLETDNEGNTLLRFDPYFTKCDSPESERALKTLASTFTQHHDSVRLEPGDFLVVCNRVVAHARSSFKPTYSKNDRWLQRLIIK